ncbi:MAG TPA: radical SAM protein [Elusimicrobiota bacterium]|nr:radical SAM protein [Elusimicrobiota bacterium]
MSGSVPLSPKPDVLLIRPPRRKFMDPDRAFLPFSDRSYPLGLLSLAGALRQNGISVGLLDTWTDPHVSRIPLPRSLSYLDQYADLHYCPSPVRYYHAGTPFDALGLFFKTNRFRIVGISSLFTGYHPEALITARIIKSVSPHTTVVMGGGAVTVSPEETLSSPFVDSIVSGEGESVFPPMVKAYLSGKPDRVRDLPGIGYKRGGRPVLTPRRQPPSALDQLPRPAHDLISPTQYLTGRRTRAVPYATLMTSRGCPHRCDFCSIHLTMGHSYRAHSPRRVMEEISALVHRGIRVFHIEDDNFAYDVPRAKEILRRIIRHFGEKRLLFRCPNGMTALSLASDPELAGLMSRAGFDTITLSLESRDPAVRRLMKKPGTVSHFDEAVRRCRHARLKVITYTMLGLPYSSWKSDSLTQLYCLSAPGQSNTPIMYYPIPGTAQYQTCLKNRWIRPGARYWGRLRSECCPVSRPGYTRRDLLSLFNLSMIFQQVRTRDHQSSGWPLKSRIHSLVARPYRHRSLPGQKLRFYAKGAPSIIPLLQATHFILHRELLSVTQKTPRAVTFKIAKASKRVIDYFHLHLLKSK